MTDSLAVGSLMTMRILFFDGMMIRHIINIGANGESSTSLWEGKYNASQNKIILQDMWWGSSFAATSLSNFCSHHYRAYRHDRVSNTNGWFECTYLNSQGIWEPCDVLRKNYVENKSQPTEPEPEPDVWGSKEGEYW